MAARPAERSLWTKIEWRDELEDLAGTVLSYFWLSTIALLGSFILSQLCRKDKIPNKNLEDMLKFGIDYLEVWII